MTTQYHPGWDWERDDADQDDHEDHFEVEAPDTSWRDGDPCQACGEDGDDDDPIAHFWNAQRSAYVMMHGQCGEDAGMPLA